MIVVPAFAKRNEREQQIVAAVIIRFKAPGAPQVRQGVDGKRAVIQQHRRNDESPDECGKASQSKHRGGKKNGRHPMILVQQLQFGILVEILNDTAVVLVSESLEISHPM